MALTVALSMGNRGGLNAVVNQTLDLVATVTNTGAASVSLLSLVISAASTGTNGAASANIDQPVIAPPNSPPGTYATLAAGASASFGFNAAFLMPYSPGPSPQNPGGAAPFPGAWPANPVYVLTGVAQASDGSIGSGTLSVEVLTAIAPFPVAQGGALQFGSGFNLINLLTL